MTQPHQLADVRSVVARGCEVPWANLLVAFHVLPVALHFHLRSFHFLLVAFRRRRAKFSDTALYRCDWTNETHP